MLGPIRTVLLDVDGTLLDTREFILEAFEYALAAHSVPVPPRTAIVPEIGRPLETIYQELGGALWPSLVEAHRRFQGEHLELSVPFAGARETIEQLHDAGFALAAVTSRSRWTSVLTLEQAGIGRYFGAVVSAEDVAALKPDPAPLRRALELLMRDAAGAAMVGDTRHDVLAGRALGILTVAATYGIHGTAVLEARPDLAIGDIRELPATLGVPARTTW